jgi:hypothetical protein
MNHALFLITDEALWYKQEGRGFDVNDLFLEFTYSFRPH